MFENYLSFEEKSVFCEICNFFLYKAICFLFLVFSHILDNKMDYQTDLSFASLRFLLYLLESVHEPNSKFISGINLHFYLNKIKLPSFVSSCSCI